MSQLIGWQSAFTNLLNGIIRTPSGAIITPVYGDYLDALSGAVEVFMTIGTDFSLQIFKTHDNENVLLDDSGFYHFVNTTGQAFLISITPLPTHGPIHCEPQNGDQYEP